MKKEIIFSPNCVLISEDKEEMLEDLIADLFVSFVNNKYRKQVLERSLIKGHKGENNK